MNLVRKWIIFYMQSHGSSHACNIKQTASSTKIMLSCIKWKQQEIRSLLLGSILYMLTLISYFLLINCVFFL